VTVSLRGLGLVTQSGAPPSGWAEFEYRITPDVVIGEACARGTYSMVPGGICDIFYGETKRREGVPFGPIVPIKAPSGTLEPSSLPVVTADPGEIVNEIIDRQAEENRAAVQAAMDREAAGRKPDCGAFSSMNTVGVCEFDPSRPLFLVLALGVIVAFMAFGKR